MSTNLLPIFSSSSFMVSGLMFRSLTHFELVFVYGYIFVLRYIMVQFRDFACGCPVFPIPFIEDTIFCLLYILGSFVVNYLSIFEWAYFRISILFLWFMCLILCQYHTVPIYSFLKCYFGCISHNVICSIQYTCYIAIFSSKEEKEMATHSSILA